MPPCMNSSRDSHPRVVAVMPAFNAAATLEQTIADIPAVIGSLDVVMGEIDR